MYDLSKGDCFMKCQKCGVNEATTHIKTMINGQYTEYYLCPDCAEKMGYTNMFGDFSSEFSNLLGSFFGNALPENTGHKMSFLRKHIQRHC